MKILTILFLLISTSCSNLTKNKTSVTPQRSTSSTSLISNDLGKDVGIERRVIPFNSIYDTEICSLTKSDKTTNVDIYKCKISLFKPVEGRKYIGHNINKSPEKIGKIYYDKIGDHLRYSYKVIDDNLKCKFLLDIVPATKAGVLGGFTFLYLKINGGNRVFGKDANAALLPADAKTCLEQTKEELNDLEIEVDLFYDRSA